MERPNQSLQTDANLGFAAGLSLRAAVLCQLVPHSLLVIRCARGGEALAQALPSRFVV